MWDLATDKVGWVGAACRATMVGHMHTVRCLQVSYINVTRRNYWGLNYALMLLFLPKVMRLVSEVFILGVPG